MGNYFRGEGAGKGDKPRPVSKIKFDANWIRAFGNRCDTCKGEGIIMEESPEYSGNMISLTCYNCNGIGKVGK